MSELIILALVHSLMPLNPILYLTAKAVLFLFQ